MRAVVVEVVEEAEAEEDVEVEAEAEDVSLGIYLKLGTAFLRAVLPNDCSAIVVSCS